MEMTLACTHALGGFVCAGGLVGESAGLLKNIGQTLPFGIAQAASKVRKLSAV